MLSNMKIRSQPRQMNLATKIEYNFLKNKMKKTTTAPQVGQTTKTEKVQISLNHIAKENETARQLAQRLAREKRKATNDAGKDMAKELGDDD